jgi:hypothetical protein
MLVMMIEQQNKIQWKLKESYKKRNNGMKRSGGEGKKEGT